jgi:integrase
VIPLGPPALELLAADTAPGRQLLRDSGSPCQWTSGGTAEALGGHSGTGGSRRPPGFTTFCHSFASIGAAAGLGLPILGAILGHRHPATTARYAHFDDDPRRAAAARISNEIALALNNRSGSEVIPFSRS